MAFRFLVGATAAFFLSGLAAVGAVAPAQSPASSAKPNIVFILADDLGYGDLGCYGQKEIKTPVLDKMAAQGIRFTDAYAGETVCAPSRASLMTGMNMGHCQIRGNGGMKLTRDETVAQVLQKGGYTTALIGKWGLGGVDSEAAPNKRGFDYFFGVTSQVAAHNHYPKTLIRNDQVVKLAPGSYADDLYTSESVSFIDRTAGKPFFLYLAYTIPHFNMEAPSAEPYADKPWPKAEIYKAAMITRMDAGIGSVLDELKKKGLTDNTIVFFASDNGPHKEGGVDEKFFHSAGPLRGIKRDLYEGGIRVPMIVKWPGHVPAGKTSAFPWAFWDFLPTATSLAHATPPAGIDGVDISPVILGKTDYVAHGPLYWEFYERGFNQAVRSGPWKSFRHNRGPIELYNLDKDIGEKHNVADVYSEVAAEHAAIMDQQHVHDNNYPETGLKKKKKKRKARRKARAEANKKAEPGKN